MSSSPIVTVLSHESPARTTFQRITFCSWFSHHLIEDPTLHINDIINFDTNMYMKGVFIIALLLHEANAKIRGGYLEKIISGHKSGEEYEHGGHDSGNSKSGKGVSGKGSDGRGMSMDMNSKDGGGNGMMIMSKNMKGSKGESRAARTVRVPRAARTVSVP